MFNYLISLDQDIDMRMIGWWKINSSEFSHAIAILYNFAKQRKELKEILFVVEQ